MIKTENCLKEYLRDFPDEIEAFDYGKKGMVYCLKDVDEYSLQGTQDTYARDASTTFRRI